MSLKRNCHISVFNSNPHPKQPVSIFGSRNWRFFVTNSSTLYGTRRQVGVLIGTHHCSVQVQVHGNVLWRCAPVLRRRLLDSSSLWLNTSIGRHHHHHHHHKHQVLDRLIRSVSKVTTALSKVSSVFQLFSFFVVCSSMISKGFGFVAFFASVEISSVCIHLSCLVRL